MNPTLLISQNRYRKSILRLEKNLHSGKFIFYSDQKKRQVWNRVCRYARQLGISIKSSIAAACLAAGLCLASPSFAQPFVQQTGTANPLNGVNVGAESKLAFADIDGDGDKDAFVGEQYGSIIYYKNTGTASAPVYTLQGGSLNPLNIVDAGDYSIPAFADIDGDGDLDFFVGNYDGNILYYKNTGTATAPIFSQQTGLANPLNGVSVGYSSAPAFVDIDNDGDLDVFSGSGGYYATISYYKNNGSATTPIFVNSTNPLASGVIYYSVPTFVDIDGDGDKDAFIGVNAGNILYFKNTGTALAPVFLEQTGAGNPLNGIDIGDESAPAFLDVNGDGDFDLFVGASNGTVSYFKNNAILLPLHLLSFSGSRQNGYNQLSWKTAAEINTKSFEIEHSNDGRSFIKIAIVNTNGTTANTYTARDNAAYHGKTFYRLKMIDVDGRFTYSSVIWISSDKGAAISIYPNPVTNVVNINIGEATLLKTQAGVYDRNGRLLQSILIANTQQQVNVQSLANGVYTIKFADGSVQGFIKK